MIAAAPGYADHAFGTAREDRDTVDTPAVGRGSAGTVYRFRFDPRRDEIAVNEKGYIEYPKPVVIRIEIVCCIVLFYPDWNCCLIFKYRLSLYRVANALESGEWPGQPDDWLPQERRERLAANRGQQGRLQRGPRPGRYQKRIDMSLLALANPKPEASDRFSLRRIECVFKLVQPGGGRGIGQRLCPCEITQGVTQWTKQRFKFIKRKPVCKFN